MEFRHDNKIQNVNLFYQKANGKILGVSRRDHHDLFGLPGGKIEENETPLEAIIREVKEETGVILNQEFLLPYWERESENSNNISRTYIYDKKEDFEFTPGVYEENGGLAKWIEWDDLITGAFSIYNYRLGIHMQRFLPYVWFITYIDQENRQAPIYKNEIIDVHPLTWLKWKKLKASDTYDISLISFQQTDKEDLETYKNHI